MKIQMRNNLITVFIVIALLLVLVIPSTAATYDCSQQTSIPYQECQALVDFYNHTYHWNYSGGWLIDPDPCTWWGITCEAGYVSEIRLNSQNMMGTLPSSIGDFSNLKILLLYINLLSGPIPPELGQLSTLETLNLGQNDFTGTIPVELGNLGNLQELGLYSNHITGAIPTTFSNLSNLRSLRLDWNELSGNIPPELGNLSHLEELRLGPNQLTGEIPPEMGNLSNLKFLSLLDNQLVGSIPPEIGNLENLVDLYLYKNQLSGPMPVEIANLSNLQFLALRENQLSGSILPELGQLENLSYLGLGNNLFTGLIPSEITNLTKLTHLLLNNNQLTGFLPVELSNLVDLHILYISNNNLIGGIPSSFTNLPLWDFYFNGTNICEPQTTDFQLWKDTIINYGSSGLTCITIDFDIMPAGQNTCINSDGKGVIPIVLYGSSVFDTSQIDPASVTLDGAPVRLKGKSGNTGSYEDVNFDSYLDLVVHILDIGLYTPGVYDVNLYAITYDGQQVVSTKNVCISH